MNALDLVVLRVGDVAQLPRCLHAGAEAAAAQKE